MMAGLNLACGFRALWCATHVFGLGVFSLCSIFGEGYRTVDLQASDSSEFTGCRPHAGVDVMPGGRKEDGQI